MTVLHADGLQAVTPEGATAAVDAWRIDDDTGLIDAAVDADGDATRFVQLRDGGLVVALGCPGCEWNSIDELRADLHALDVEHATLSAAWLTEHHVRVAAAEDERRRAEAEARYAGVRPVALAQAAAQLDLLDVPVDATQQQANAALQSAGVYLGRNVVLASVLALRARVRGVPARAAATGTNVPVEPAQVPRNESVAHEPVPDTAHDDAVDAMVDTLDRIGVPDHAPRYDASLALSRAQVPIGSVSVLLDALTRRQGRHDIDD